MSPERPHVRVEPGVRFGQPHVKGISTWAVAGLVYAGESVERTAEDYGLSLEEVFVALWFEAQHGEYRRQWADWLLRADAVLAHGRPLGELEPPPAREELSGG